MSNNSDSAIIIFVVIAIASLCVGPWLIMLLWGALASVFGFMTISYGQAWLVYLALCLIRVILK